MGLVKLNDLQDYWFTSEIVHPISFLGDVPWFPNWLFSNSSKRMVAAEADDECSSVSLDLSCDSSSFDSDDCGTNAEEVSDCGLIF